ncbi:CRISPR system precrRNA processing endoribonuclease RAMP protein Cas6 [Aeromicrobium duanguangcaii]|uniref:CRISPR system precrRNA processing endoribonuclease RAMP protein Cas6 n=1 Tax=Aeromicrobium duanguangcaii TaxID=2968086 RepID=UPI003D25B63F
MAAARFVAQRRQRGRTRGRASSTDRRQQSRLRELRGGRGSERDRTTHHLGSSLPGRRLVSHPWCVRWHLEFQGDDLPRATPRHLHAAVSWLVDEDHQAPEKPWSVLPPRRSPLGGTVVEIATLDEGAGRRLLDRARAGHGLRLGDYHLRLEQPPVPLDEARFLPTWRSSGADRWTLTFRSPTAISAQKKYSPWLDPSSVIRSLLLRWNALYSPEHHLVIPEPRILSRVSVTAFSGETVDAIMYEGHHSRTGSNKNPYRGAKAALVEPHQPRIDQAFVGSMTYTCNDSHLAPLVELLFSWAPFAGIGARTTRGFGAVTVNASQPSTRPRD